MWGTSDPLGKIEAGREKRSSETRAPGVRAERKLLQGKGQHLPGSCRTGTQERRMVRQTRKFVVAISSLLQNSSQIPGSTAYGSNKACNLVGQMQNQIMPVLSR